MNNLVKNVLIFSAGAVVGALAGIQLVKKKYEAIAEEEINAMREYTNKKKTEKDGSEHRQKTELTEKGNYKKVSRVYNDPEQDPELEKEIEKEELSKKNEYTEYEERSKDANQSDYPEPYIITLEQFSEECAHYGKENLYYYKGDDTICDVDEQIVTAEGELIGYDALGEFDDHNTVYVRNERLQIDYEIIQLNGKYSVLVCGMNDEKDE